MKGNFKVGEVCIGQHLIYSTGFNGVECEIVGTLQMRKGIRADSGCLSEECTYLVQWSNGIQSNVFHHNLRRKQPPTGELSILNMFVVAPPKCIKEPA